MYEINAAIPLSLCAPAMSVDVNPWFSYFIRCVLYFIFDLEWFEYDWDFFFKCPQCSRVLLFILLGFFLVLF